MAQQPWNIGNAGAEGGPQGPSSTGSSKGVPPDVLLLGPRDEKDMVMAPPRMEPKADKPDLRPAPASYMPAPRKAPRTRRTIMALAGLALVGVGIPSIAYLRSGSTAPDPAPAVPAVAAAPANATVVMGSATVISRPDGATVFVNGAVKGVTPLTVTLPVGTYTMELQNGTMKRSLPLVVEAGAVVRQYVDLAPSLAEGGRLEVTSEPSGAQVSVDGTPRGVTPLVIASIEPGQHRVTIAGQDGSVNRTVNVAAGTSASVVVTLGGPAGAAGGWITVAAPFELQVLENGQVIGSSTMDRLMLPAGKHDLELVSEAFEFRAQSSVQVPAGKTVAVPLVLPKGSLSINALPWADVWLDGQPMGTTPLGNLSVSVGNHEVIWRHPQLGERRQVVKVTGRAPVRAGMDLTK